jgi:DNA-binding transcriptional LysR family regulator
VDGVDDLVLFAAVVAEGGFSGAGRALGIPKSRVSRRIDGLERRLGLRLLQRSTRTVQATEVGIAFYRRCEAVVDAARAALEVAELARAKPSGRLRVSCPVGVAYRFLAPGLPGFLLAHPEVRLELELTNRHVDLIGEGFDLALRSRPTLDDPNLIVRTFGESPQVLVASPEYVLRCGPFDSIAALRTGVGLGPAGLHRERPAWCLREAQGQTVDVEYTCALVTDDLHLLMQSVLAGVGIAQLPFNLCAAAIDDGRLQVLLPNYALPANQLHAVFPSRRGLAPAVRAFLDMLAAQLPAIMARNRRP